MDATSMWLLPEDLMGVTTADFDDMLADLEAGIAKGEGP
jgi:hypothetical protein